MNTKESPFGCHYNFQCCSTYVFQTLFFFSNLEHCTDLRLEVVTDLQLFKISKDIGHQWKELGYILGIGIPSISILDEDCKDRQEKALSLLINWKRQSGNGATLGILVDALNRMGQNHTAQKLLGKMMFC